MPLVGRALDRFGTRATMAAPGCVVTLAAGLAWATVVDSGWSAIERHTGQLAGAHCCAARGRRGTRWPMKER